MTWKDAYEAARSGKRVTAPPLKDGWIEVHQEDGTEAIYACRTDRKPYLLESHGVALVRVKDWSIME